MPNRVTKGMLLVYTNKNCNLTAKVIDGFSLSMVHNYPENVRSDKSFFFEQIKAEIVKINLLKLVTV